MERAENVFAFVEFSSLRVAARDGASFGPSSQRPLMVILGQDQHRGSTDRGMEKVTTSCLPQGTNLECCGFLAISGCESWTIVKDQKARIKAFETLCMRQSLMFL